ncbi:MAG: bifunctional pyr operon transcriptional regulator/uracil phosphoribosyltransferase PyrR [Bacilli bacterium]
MKEIIDHATMNRMLTRITHELLERNKTIDNAIILGIQRRGLYLAQRIALRLEELYEIEIEVEALDISNYRDDRIKSGNPSGINSDLSNKLVILVDDVLFTGRSIRAALDAIVEHGRPSQIQLVTLVDRGHREYPIRPDYVGKNIPTSKHENVVVNVEELDGIDNVIIEDDE